MARRLFCYFLVVLALVMAGLWIRSYQRQPMSGGHSFTGGCAALSWGDGEGVHMVVRVGGLCVSHHGTVDANAVPPSGELIVSANLGMYRYGPSAYKPCPLNAAHRFTPPPGKALVVRGICVPLWLMTIVFAAYPAIVLVYRPLRTRLRVWRGRCPSCGYDLMGNQSGVCPECGSRCPHQ